MADFPPIRPFDQEFPSVNPTPTPFQRYTLIGAGAVGNDQLANGIDPRKLQGVGIKVYRSTSQTIADITDTDITYDTIVFREGFPDPGASFTKVTAPYAGVYLIVSQIEWGADVNNRRSSWIEINDVVTEGDTRNGTAGQNTRVALPAIRSLAAGDTIGVRVRQNSGGNLNVAAGEDSDSLTVMFQGSF